MVVRYSDLGVFLFSVVAQPRGWCEDALALQEEHLFLAVTIRQLCAWTVKTEGFLWMLSSKVGPKATLISVPDALRLVLLFMIIVLILCT